MIEELGQQLRMFDKAFEKMYKDKASREDLELLKLSVDESRAKSIFNDMRDLFDSTVADMKKQQEVEKEKMRAAFQFVIN